MNSNGASGMLGSMEREKAGLMHDDVIDNVGKRALDAMKQITPEFSMTGTSIRRSVRVSGLRSSMQRGRLI